MVLILIVSAKSCVAMDSEPKKLENIKLPPTAITVYLSRLIYCNKILNKQKLMRSGASKSPMFGQWKAGFIAMKNAIGRYRTFGSSQSILFIRLSAIINAIWFNKQYE